MELTPFAAQPPQPQLPSPNCIPLLTCHLHQGLIAHGEHLSRRCSGLTEDLHRHRGWAPEVA